MFIHLKTTINVKIILLFIYLSVLWFQSFCNNSFTSGCHYAKASVNLLFK